MTSLFGMVIELYYGYIGYHSNQNYIVFYVSIQSLIPSTNFGIVMTPFQKVLILLQKCTLYFPPYKTQNTHLFIFVHNFICSRGKNWHHAPLESLWNYLSNHIYVFIYIFSR